MINIFYIHNNCDIRYNYYLLNNNIILYNNITNIIGLHIKKLVTYKVHCNDFTSHKKCKA